MKIYLIILSFVLAASALAQDRSDEFNLVECLAYARENSPTHKKFELIQMQSDARIKIERSKFLPQVNAYTDYQQFFEIPTFIFPANEGEILSSGSSEGEYPVRIGQEFNLFAGARISQTLFDKRWMSTKQALELNSEMLQLRERSVEEELAMKISQAFFEVEKLQIQMDLVDSNINKLSEVLSVLRLQYSNGVLKKSELQKMELSIGRLSANKDRISGAIAVRVAQLKFMMGMPDDQNLSISPEGYDLDELVAQSSGSPSLEIALFENRLRSGEVNIKSVADSYFPKVKAFADFQFQAQRSSFNFLSDEKWHPRHVLGVGINVPIFTGFEKKGRIQLEEIKVDEVALEKENAEKKARLNLNNRANEMRFSEQAVQNEKANKELSDELYRQVLLEYEQGVSTVSDLILASIQQIEASNQYEEAIFDYKLAQMNYLKASSGLGVLFP